MNQPSPTNQLTVDDVIAPTEIEVDFSYLRINQLLYKSFFVSNYPRYIDPNWLEPLIDFDHSLNIAMHIYPTNSKTVLDDLKRKVAEMEATIQTDLERGHVVNPAVQVALDDARDLQEQLVKGSERFFRLGLYITIPASSKEELNNVSKLAESTLGSLSITARETSLQMEDTFISTLPTGLDLLDLNHNMDTTSLATTFPFTTSELTSNEGIMYGINEHNDSLIVFDRFSLENANSVVFAKSGSGKSTYSKERVLYDDGTTPQLKEIGLIVEDLIKKKGAQKIDEEMEGVINPGWKVWTFDQNLKGQWSNVTAAARKKFSPRNRLYKITTKSGRSITVTADHNLVILRKGKLRVMRSEAVKLGEAMPVPRSITDNRNTLAEIEAKNYVADWPDGVTQRFCLDKPFLGLLGLITSEGHIARGFLQVHNEDPEVLRFISNSITKLGLRFTPIYKYPGKTKVRGYNIKPSCTYKLICALGADGLSGKKSAPPLLFSLSNKQVAYYLSAYFEGDGGVEKDQVCATTKSPQLASDLAYLLLRFGIIARIHSKQKYASNTLNRTKDTYYQITVSGQDNLLKFNNYIGFLTDTKNNKLQQSIFKMGKTNTNIDTIPTLQPIFRYLHKSLFSSSETHSPQNLVPMKNGAFNPSRGQLQKFIEDCENRIKELRSLNSHIQLLRKLPSLPAIISKGTQNRNSNRRLWQSLGASWQSMRQQLSMPFTKNVLIAYQTITGNVLVMSSVNTALYESFKQQGLSLRDYDRPLWTSIVDRKTGNSHFTTIFNAAKYITKKYRSTQLKIRHAEKKLSQLRLLANSDLFWDPITKVERIKHKEKWVYDLQVDNEVFLAGTGGLFVHNSYFVKLEAIRSMMFGTQIIVIDPEREYLKLAEAVGGTYINFSSDSPVKINPFDLSALAKEGENELGEKILSLTSFLKLVLGSLNASQSAILDRAISSTYRLKGITSDPRTQTLPAPLMEDLYKVLIGMEDAPSQELAFRLERFIKGSLTGIFSAPTNININNQLTVFSVRDLPEELRPLAMHLIIDYIWTAVRRDFKKRLLIVDEAWYMMKNPDSASFLTEIAKRARKYYLGLTTITTDVEDFLAGDHGKEVISNSSIQVLMKQSPASIDRIGEMFYLSEGEKRLLLSAGIGQGLFFAGPAHVAIRVVASPLEHQLITTNPAEIQATTQDTR